MVESNNFIFNCLQSFVLGIIQVITEFLPISSTAHLKVVPHSFGWNDPGISISSFFSSIFAIEFLINFLAKNNTFIFVYYRLFFGILILSTL